MGRPANVGTFVGHTFGNYELLALLAVGGTAEIYLARSTGIAGFHKYVVVKRLHDHLTADEEYVSMFLDEARLGALLHHTNIAQVLELGQEGDTFYIVMEYVAGMSLALIAKRAGERFPEGILPTEVILGLVSQTCDGLHYAHERKLDGKKLGIVHRDISPQNLVVTFEGILKVVDFGIAKSTRKQVRTKAGTVKGKFAYMSPEQCRATGVDARTDVFALGTILYELLTGRRLFKRETAYDTYQAILAGEVPPPSRVRPTITASIDNIVMKAIAYSAENRFQSAQEFGEAVFKELSSRGKFCQPSDIARFFRANYAPEIEKFRSKMERVASAFPRDSQVQLGSVPSSEDDKRSDAEEELSDTLDTIVTERSQIEERPESIVTTSQGLGAMNYSAPGPTQTASGEFDAGQGTTDRFDHRKNLSVEAKSDTHPETMRARRQSVPPEGQSDKQSAAPTLYGKSAPKASPLAAGPPPALPPYSSGKGPKPQEARTVSVKAMPASQSGGASADAPTVVPPPEQAASAPTLYNAEPANTDASSAPTLYGQDVPEQVQAIKDQRQGHPRSASHDEPTIRPDDGGAGLLSANLGEAKSQQPTQFMEAPAPSSLPAQPAPVMVPTQREAALQPASKMPVFLTFLVAFMLSFGLSVLIGRLVLV